MSRLKAHKDYIYTPATPGEKPRKVTFLAWAGKGWCKVIDCDGPRAKCGHVYNRVPRFRLSEIPLATKPAVQGELL